MLYKYDTTKFSLKEREEGREKKTQRVEIK